MFYTHVNDIHSEGTVSQNVDTGLSFIFMLKNGKIVVLFL